MKEFIKTQKITYNLMSFTAFKALILFSELVDGPKSFADIAKVFREHSCMREQISTDTIRVYMNSLKRLGCEIKRIKTEEKESKYVISKHPFELNYTPEQLESALKIFKNLVKNIELEELIDLENFFEKIGKYIKNEDFINKAKKISLLKNIDKNLLKQLIDLAKNKNKIIITYDSPNSGIKNVELIANELIIENNKIYLNAFGFEYMQYANFLVNRILKIDEIKTQTDLPNEFNKVTVIYELTNQKPELEPYEKIIGNKNGITTIEATTSNIFHLKQKLLSLGPNCKIVSPNSFKEEFIQLLKDMKAGYYCG